MNRTGTLYLIPTFLGENSSSTIPEYVCEIAWKLDEFIVENEKSARRFLKKIGYPKSLDALNLYPLNKRIEAVDFSSYLAPLLAGKDMGILSEAGCPGIADPGAEIVGLAHQKSISVKPLVGPSSILLAMMASGMNGQSFVFHGYLPVQKNERTRAIKNMESLSTRLNQAQIFMETPYRNNQLLADLLSNCRTETRLCIATDISLSSEKINTKTIGEWKKHKPDIHKRPVIFVMQGG